MEWSRVIRPQRVIRGKGERKKKPPSFHGFQQNCAPPSGKLTLTVNEASMAAEVSCTCFRGLSRDAGWVIDLKAPGGPATLRKLRRAMGRVNHIPEGEIKTRGDHSAPESKVLYCLCGRNPNGTGGMQIQTYGRIHFFFYSKKFEKKKKSCTPQILALWENSLLHLHTSKKNKTALEVHAW